MEWNGLGIKPSQRDCPVLVWYNGDYDFGWYKEGAWWIYKDSEWKCVVDQDGVTNWCLLRKP